MSGFYEHLENFFGLVVVPYDATANLDPSEIAWSVGLDPDTYWRARDRSVSAADSVRLLAEKPFAGKVPAIVVGPWSFEGDVNADVVIAALVEHAPRFPSVRAIFLGDIVQEEQEISWIQQGDVTPLLRTYPALEVLHVRGSEGLTMKPVDHKNLRELVFQTGGLPKEVVSAILKSKLPALEHLELWLGGFEYERSVEIKDLDPLFSGDAATYRTTAPFPKLRYLGLRNASDADEIAAKLATAPIVSQLEEFDLSMGTLGDDGGEALLASPLIRGLRKLNLSHHYLSEEMQQRLGALSIRVDLSAPEGEADPDERYTSVSE